MTFTSLMQQADKDFILLKFSDNLDHLKTLRENGLVYMNTLEHFRNLEDEQRGDRFEGSIRIWQPDAVEVAFNVPVLGSYTSKSGDLVGPIKYHPQRLCAVSVFCTAAIPLPARGGHIRVDRATVGLGKWVMVIAPRAFSSRLEAAAPSAGYSFASGFVEYRDFGAHTGVTGPFLKSVNFKHQKEFRFLIDRGTRTCEPFSLSVGSLKDVSPPILASETINQLVWMPQQSI